MTRPPSHLRSQLPHQSRNQVDTQLGHESRAQCQALEAPPLSLLLYRYIWPFWLFKDATRGDCYARAAAYQHNRIMRIYLPGYLLKWVISCGLAFVLMLGLDSLAGAPRNTIDIFILMAAAAGILFACGVCVLFITAYLYLYLTRNRN